MERKVLLETYDDEPSTLYSMATSRIPIPIKNLKLKFKLMWLMKKMSSGDDEGEEWQNTLFKVTKDERNGLTKCLLRTQY